MWHQRRSHCTLIVGSSLTRHVHCLGRSDQLNATNDEIDADDEAANPHPNPRHQAQNHNVDHEEDDADEQVGEAQIAVLVRARLTATGLFVCCDWKRT